MKRKTGNAVLKAISDFLLITVGALLLSVSTYLFTIPAQFAPGGITGVSVIVQVLTGFNAAYTILICNVPLLIASFLILSKKLTFRSIYGIIMTSAFLRLFSAINLYTYVSDQPIIAALAGGILGGAGVGIMIRSGGSSGGTEIIGLLIQKKVNTLSVSWIILFINIVIILCGGTLYAVFLKMDLSKVITIVLFSFLQSVVSSKSMDTVLNGLSSAVKFEVVTNKPDELSAAILSRLNRGATLIKSKGAYTHTEHDVLICVVTRMQIKEFKKLLKEVDPSAFAYAIDTREVLGVGFRSKQ